MGPVTGVNCTSKRMATETEDRTAQNQRNLIGHITAYAVGLLPPASTVRSAAACPPWPQSSHMAACMLRYALLPHLASAYRRVQIAPASVHPRPFAVHGTLSTAPVISCTLHFPLHPLCRSLPTSTALSGLRLPSPRAASRPHAPFAHHECRWSSVGGADPRLRPSRSFTRALPLHPTPPLPPPRRSTSSLHAVRHCLHACTAPLLLPPIRRPVPLYPPTSGPKAAPKLPLHTRSGDFARAKSPSSSPQLPPHQPPQPRCRTHNATAPAAAAASTSMTRHRSPPPTPP
ncbi:hypothetical protein B0H10DRAFT_691009 [Mycena sp. CBHHK59/15]|nr:hypothetical protein B0H10DRAFT_691009 [Mycena sp. CBHHK59/15]